MKFELTKEFITELKSVIAEQNISEALNMLQDIHAADIAEIFDELDTSESQFIFFQLEPRKAANILVELEDEDIDTFLRSIPGSIVASDLIEKMSSDDATDIIQHLPHKLRHEILGHLKSDHAGAIADLLTYDEDTAGGLMGKELVRVNINWNVSTCMAEIRRQAETIQNIYSVYVVDNNNVLKGTLPIKKLIINDGTVKVGDILDDQIISVSTDTSSEEVANIMDKYDLVVLPVVDPINRLKGRITIDDVVDVIREEAEKDYQMVSGIAQDVESSDSVWKHSKARLPWLIIGMVGGVAGAQIIGTFEDEFKVNAGLAMFLPLIAGMAGNVGVQASSIIVQSIANQSIGFESIFTKLLKELFGGLLIGSICAGLILAFNAMFLDSFALTITVSISLLAVIVFASIFGTFVPLVLHRAKIDPALATGPFITTANDIIGLFIYLLIARSFFQYF